MAAIVLFCLALLVCIVLRTNILYALLAGLVIFTLYGNCLLYTSDAADD